MPKARPTRIDSLGVINLIGSNLTDRYPPSSILKELIQNADDAEASQILVGWTPKLTGEPAHQLLHGPAIFVINDGPFDNKDAEAICRFGQNYKSGEKAVIGKFGLGLKSVFHLCEAFFYLSSTTMADASETDLFNNLASPWSDTEYHRGWNDVEDRDLRLLSDYLQPLWETLGTDWFALWLPLRQRAYCEQGKSKFTGRFDGDQTRCPDEFMDLGSLQRITLALPLLHKLSLIRVWERWEGTTITPTLEASLLKDSQRSCFRQWSHSPQSPAPMSGRGQLQLTTGTNGTTSDYVLAQVWAADLMRLTQDHEWPRSFVLEGGGQQPDKAQPHAAVILNKRHGSSVGKVDVVLAVFLPLDGRRAEQASEFSLVVHGCFFVDAGRRYALHEGDDIRGQWNRRLWNEGIMPLVLPAVVNMAEQLASEPEAIRRLTAGLINAKRQPNDEQSIYQQYREAICGEGNWLYRWGETCCWQLVNHERPILPLPDFDDATLPSVTLPRLSEFAANVVLTPCDWPRLTRSELAAWTDDQLATVVVVDDPAVLVANDGRALEYLVRFLSLAAPNGLQSLAAIQRILQQLFSRIGTRSLRHHGDMIRRLVRFLPKERRRGLPMPNNWPDEVRHQLSAQSDDLLLMPSEFEPDSAQGTANLPTEFACRLLNLISPHVVRTNDRGLARAIVNASAERAYVLNETAELPLWYADGWTYRETRAGIVTLRTLRSANMIGGAFAGQKANEAKELASALANQSVLLLTPDLAVELFPTDAPPFADARAITATLARHPALADVPYRVDLLRSLLTQRPDATWHAEWRSAVRYLLHAHTGIPIDAELFMNSTTSGVWARLTTTALDANGQPERILPDNELTRLLNEQQYRDLGISRLDVQGIGKLLETVNLASMDVQFTSAERDEVLGQLYAYPKVLCGLPLHDRYDGQGMDRLNDQSYWYAPRFTPSPALAAKVRLFRRRPDDRLASVQNQIHKREFDEPAALAFMLNHQPSQYWRDMLNALKSAGTLATQLRNDLAAVEWLPCVDGTFVAPRNVMHDDTYGDLAAACLRLVRTEAGDLVPSRSLDVEVRSHEVFEKLDRLLFSDEDERLRRLAATLSRDSTFCIGAIELRTHEEITAWWNAFRNAPDEVMRVQELVSLVQQSDHELCISHFLPALRSGDMAPERLCAILAYLANGHEKKTLQAAHALPTFHRYLALLASKPEVFRKLLPQLRLRNQAGAWCEPKGLCAGATGIDPTQALHTDEEDILKQVIPRQQPKAVARTAKANEPQPISHLIAGFHLAADTLKKYFASWREQDEQVAEWVGAFIALLGDFEPLAKLTKEMLGRRMSADMVRSTTGLEGRDRHDPNGRLLSESRALMMERQRFLIEVTPRQNTLPARNLLEDAITVRPNANVDDLFIGYGIHDAQLFLERNMQVHHLNLREIDPKTEPKERKRLLETTAARLLREVYQQKNADFSLVLDELAENQSSDVWIAQAEMLDAAGHYLRQFGLGQTEVLADILKAYDAAATRRAEEKVAKDQNRELDGDSSDTLYTNVCQRLRDVLETNSTACQAILEGIRRKLADNRYQLRSVLFELFQNADDAYAELDQAGDHVFFVATTRDTLTVVHEGRRINHQDPTNAGKGHARDLRKMLSLGHSDKGFGSQSSNVTGRFGLGFKSVYLLTDHPAVVSGRLTFEVLGGIYPRPLGQSKADALRQQIETCTVKDAAKATLFSLPTRSGINQNDVVQPFMALAHLLVVFARQIRTIRVQGADDLRWTETELLQHGDTRIVSGSLHPHHSATGPNRALVVRTPVGAILFGLASTGFAPMPNDVPTVWVTAPTTEKHDFGFLVNAAFTLDIGRAQVDWNETKNDELGKKLARYLGDALLAFDQHISTHWNDCADKLRLAPSIDREELWHTWWEIVTNTTTAPNPLQQMIWGFTGAATRLLSDRPTLPTGFAFPPHDRLTTLSNVRWVLCGLLDQQAHTDVLRQVATWPVWQRLAGGSIVSERKIWSIITRYEVGCASNVERVDLTWFVQRSVTNRDIMPTQADQLGKVVRVDAIRTFPADEVGQLLSVLQGVRFRSQAGTWVAASALLLTRSHGGTGITDRQDELLRAEFAPSDCLLAADYTPDGASFFYVCRGEMNADAERLADWMANATTPDVRRSALRYLLRGELGRETARRLRATATRTWLGEFARSPLRQEFASHDQQELLAMLGLLPPLPVGTMTPLFAPPPPANPAVCLARIAEWWRTNRRTLLREYEASLYPAWYSPTFSEDNPDYRRSWLAVFIAATLLTAGRTQREHVRVFLQLCADRGWLDILLQPDSSHRWLTAVEQHIDQQQGAIIPGYHRLRQFIGIATMARHLDDYIAGFMTMEQIDGRFSLTDILNQRASGHFQGTSLEAPPLGSILGFGACLVVRELVRSRTVNNPRANGYCYVPSASVRRLLGRLGWQEGNDRDQAPWHRSRAIYRFVREHHPNDATFCRAFDIPLQLLADDEELLRNVLGDALPTEDNHHV